MRPQDVARLLVLGALWGGSFIFMRVASPVFGPICTIAMRVLIAGVVLLVWAGITHARLEIKTRWPQYLVLGALNSAAPFALICWAELRLSASMAAILNATSPIFGAIVAAVWLRDRLTPPKLIGLVTAFAGVSVLVGWSPIPIDSSTVLAIGGSLLASICYAFAATYTKLKAKSAPPLGMAVGSMMGATVCLVPFVPFSIPSHVPHSSAWACVAALALLSTALAYILYYRLVVDIGPSRALTVTFVAPIFGVLWGLLFLGEPLTLAKALACLIVLLGTALVTGALPHGLQKRPAFPRAFFAKGEKEA